MGLSTSQLRDAWSPPCNSGNFVTVNLHGEGRVTIDPRTLEAVNKLNDILIAWNYRTRSSDTGAYNCRKITGGSGYSLHAYGIALDLNWSTNPYGPTLVTDMPRGMCDEITALRTNNGCRVWEWGGNWSGNKDAMHYEIDCSPADLATGIVGGTRPPEEEPPIGAITMFIAIDSVALCALMGNVLFTFKDLKTYGDALNASPNVPALVIPNSEPLDARHHIHQELIKQHIVAVGQGDALPQ